MLVMLYAYTFATTFATNTFPSFNHLSEEAIHTFLIRVVVNRKVIQVFRDEEMVRTDRVRFKKKKRNNVYYHTGYLHTQDINDMPS